VSTLPVHLSGFIGREREIAAVRALLVNARLLTLTGVGGSGKTRLAAEIAEREATAGANPAEATAPATTADADAVPASATIAAAPAMGAAERVAWVELASVGEPSLIADRVCAALEIREQPGRSAQEALLEVLRTRELLLVLDNCEHVVDAAAELTDVLLRGCPGLRVLATSREALGVAGEVAWLVPPLSLPNSTDTATIAQAESVQLFCDRARAVLPSFELHASNAVAVADICRRLDGIPLAIELAAARLRVLSAEQIRDRLDDCFRLLTTKSRTALPRHRTLRAVIDWSYTLLNEEERTLLARLSVFAGTFDLDAVEAVCSCEVIEDVLDPLSALVDKSLVELHEVRGSARYRLLETVRRYAAEHLEEAGETNRLRQAHLEHYVQLAEQYYSRLSDNPRLREWMDELDAEHDNLRAALDWSHRTPAQSQRCIRLAGALWWFWFYRVLWREGLYWLEEVLRFAEADSAPGLLTRVQHGAGLLAYLLGDNTRAEAQLERALTSAKAVNDQRQLGLVQATLVHVRAGHYTVPAEREASLALGREALGLANRYGTAWDKAFTSTIAVGYCAHLLGRLDEADASYATAEVHWRELESEWGLALVLWARSGLASQRGDTDAALALGRSALPYVKTLRDPWTTARALTGLAGIISRRGDHVRATRILAHADRLREVAGAEVQTFERGEYGALINALREKLGSHFEQCWSEGGALSADDAWRLVEEDAPDSTTTIEVSSGSTAVPDQVRAGRTVAGDPDIVVNALGSLQLFVGGQEIDNKVWSYAKPRELLVYLLLYPGGRTREQIGAALWPDATPSQVRNSVHVTLHHLRKGLGRPEAVQYASDRYRTDPGLVWELDALRFQAAATEGIRAREASERVLLLQPALELYRGEFLESIVAGDWHLEYREKLARLHGDALVTFGEALLALGRVADALPVFQRVIARDDLREDAHRGVIRCRLELGDRAGALQHYRRFASHLRDELGAEPHPITRALVESLHT